MLYFWVGRGLEPPDRDRVASDPRETQPSPRVVTNLLALGEKLTGIGRGRNYLQRFARKIGPLASHISRSLMFVVTDTDLSANCDVLNVVQLHFTELGYFSKPATF